jgi:hypothetical protein
LSSSADAGDDVLGDKFQGLKDCLGGIKDDIKGGLGSLKDSVSEGTKKVANGAKKLGAKLLREKANMFATKANAFDAIAWDLYSKAKALNKGSSGTDASILALQLPVGGFRLAALSPSTTCCLPYTRCFLMFAMIYRLSHFS